MNLPYRLLCFCLCITYSFCARAQTLKGVVTDAVTKQPLFPVVVVDIASGLSATTDEHGVYALATKAGDRITFSFIGYLDVQKAVPASTGIVTMNAEMEPKTYRLHEYTLQGLTPYQQDSVEMRALYSKELDIHRVKPQLGNSDGPGIAVSGLIGSLVQGMSKGYKKSKAFKSQFEKDEQQKFIDTKYTPVLVHALTGLTGDSMEYFRIAFPMDYAFARHATELELKMWIRDSYRQYLHKRKDKDGRVVADTP